MLDEINALLNGLNVSHYLKNIHRLEKNEIEKDSESIDLAHDESGNTAELDRLAIDARLNNVRVFLSNWLLLQFYKTGGSVFAIFFNGVITCCYCCTR